MVTVEDEKNTNRAFCYECGSTLLYNAEDRRIGTYGSYYITCPVCLNDVPVDHERHEKIICPDSFSKFGKTGTVPENKDEKIQECINDLIKDYKEYRDKEEDFGGYMFYASGNILVVLFEEEDDIVIRVAEGYYEDFIEKERIDDFY